MRLLLCFVLRSAKRCRPLLAIPPGTRLRCVWAVRRDPISIVSARNGALTPSDRASTLHGKLDPVLWHLDVRIFKCEQIWHIVGVAHVQCVRIASLYKKGVAHSTILVFGHFVVSIRATPRMLLPRGVAHVNPMVLVVVVNSKNTTIARVDAHDTNVVLTTLGPIATRLPSLARMRIERWVRVIGAEICLSLEVHDRITVLFRSIETVIEDLEPVS